MNTARQGDARCGRTVLVVENEPSMRADHAENLRRWGYEPVVVEGEGQALLDNAIATARSRRCHVALVDMRLRNNYDSDDTSGLELVKRLKPTASIIVSAYGDIGKFRDAIEKGALKFFGKHEKPDVLRGMIDAIAQAECGCRHDLQIDWPYGLSPADIRDNFFPDDLLAPDDEAACLIGRLFPEAARLNLQRLSGATRTASLAPRQRSVVLQINQGATRQPVIVKIARPDRIATEVGNYRDAIKGRLGGLFYSQLIRSNELWDIGGALYTFLGSFDAQIASFSQYYTEHSATKIKRTLQRFFGETWAWLYDEKRRCEGSLFGAYSAIWGAEWHDRLARYPDQAALLAGAPLRLPNPVPWLIKRVSLAESDRADASNLGPTFQAVTHGDLHGDNIFVDNNGIALVIDFERAGWGPVLQDFVELEADILTRLAALKGDEADHLALFCELAVAVAGPKRLGARLESRAKRPEIDKALGVIGEMRKLACEQAGVKDAREYLWGLLFNAVFRATLPHDHADDGSWRMRALILGGVICQRLDYWDAPWPPPEWPAPPGDAPRAARPPRDRYALYAAGVERLLGRLGRDHPRYAEALTYQQRLAENIDHARRYGDDETHTVDRSKIIDRLNELGLATLGVSFNDLCEQADRTR